MLFFFPIHSCIRSLIYILQVLVSVPSFFFLIFEFGLRSLTYDLLGHSDCPTDMVLLSLRISLDRSWRWNLPWRLPRLLFNPLHYVFQLFIKFIYLLAITNGRVIFIGIAHISKRLQKHYSVIDSHKIAYSLCYSIIQNHSHVRFVTCKFIHHALSTAEPPQLACLYQYYIFSMFFRRISLLLFRLSDVLYSPSTKFPYPDSIGRISPESNLI